MKKREKDAEAKRLSEVTAEGLTPQQRLFVAYYIQTMNAAEAVRMAGYADGAGNSPAHRGYELLKMPAVKAAIENYLKEIYLPVVEMKARMSEQARGTMESFLDVSDEGEIKFNFKKAKDDGALRLIKTFKMKETFVDGGKDPATGARNEPTRIVQTEVTLYDAQDALEQIGKLEGLYREHIVVENSGENGPVSAMMNAYNAGKELDTKKKKANSGNGAGAIRRK